MEDYKPIAECFDHWLYYFIALCFDPNSTALWVYLSNLNFYAIRSDLIKLVVNKGRSHYLVVPFDLWATDENLRVGLKWFGLNHFWNKNFFNIQRI